MAFCRQIVADGLETNKKIGTPGDQDAGYQGSRISGKGKTDMRP
jgi:hypothetical protein